MHRFANMAAYMGAEFRKLLAEVGNTMERVKAAIEVDRLQECFKIGVTPAVKPDTVTVTKVER